MKTKILAIGIFCAVVCYSIFNSYFLGKEIEALTGKIEDLEIDDENTDAALSHALQIREEFGQRKSYISISVNHEDLSNIETIFAEMIGQLEVGSADDAKVAKSRLIDALGHLRRLSGVNIDTII